MGEIFIDIETVPLGEPIDPKKMSPPKSMSVPETIADWYKTKAVEASEKEYRSRSLIPHKSQILCISAAVGVDEEPECWTGKEHIILKAFRDYLKEKHTYDEFFATLNWFGWNVRFDITNIRMAAYKCGEAFFKHPQHMPPLTRYDSRIVDLMEAFIKPMTTNTYKVSLDDACKYFGIKGKGDIDGSQVFDYWQEDRIQEICDYCIEDVIKCQKLYDRIF